MRNRCALVAGVFLWAWVLSLPLAAQYTSVSIHPDSLPSDWKMAGLANGIAWEMNYTPAWELNRGLPISKPRHPQMAPDRSFPRKVLGRQLDGILFEKRRYADGFEDWIAHTPKYVVYPDAEGVPVIQSKADYYEGRTASAGQFTEFLWIGRESFAGQTIYHGVPCLVFRKMANNHTDSPSILGTAFLNRDTRLPVALEDSSGIRRYRFSENHSPLEIPEAVRNLDANHADRPERKLKRYQVPRQ